MSPTGRETTLKLYDAVMQVYKQQFVYSRNFVSATGRGMVVSYGAAPLFTRKPLQ